MNALNGLIMKETRGVILSLPQFPTQNYHYVPRELK